MIKKIIPYIITLILISGVSFAAAVKSLQADQWLSADLTKTYTPPSITTQLIGVSDTATVINKTFTNPAITSPTITGGLVSGSTVRNPTIQNSSGAVLTLPTSSADTFVILAGSQTLTNKTIQSPVMTGNWVASGTVNVSGTNLVTPTISGTITVNNNLVMANAMGISFAATSNNAGSSSEVFSDYDFGSVSVPVAATGTSGTPAYTLNWGTYEKIGRRVSLDAYVNVSSWAGSPTGNVRFTLPFQSSNINANYRSSCKVGYMDNMNFPIVGTASGVISNNSAYMDLYIVPSSGTTTTAVPVDTAFLIMFTCEYVAD